MTKTPTDRRPPKEEVWAFWKYDTFPYVLSGRVTQLHDDGHVSVDGYRGYKFTPICLLIGKRGADAHAYIRAARNQYRSIKEAGENAMHDELREGFKRMGAPVLHVPFKPGSRYPAVGAIFRDAIAKVQRGEAPDFPFNPDPSDANGCKDDPVRVAKEFRRKPTVRERIVQWFSLFVPFDRA